MKQIMEKNVPHCIFCEEEMVAGQFVYLDGINGIVHAKCSEWKEDFIQDKGKYEEIVSKYPLYFEKLKV
ncbi:hypothetical protein P9D43_20940 [Neobacillus niacini]|uniref:hypothetical protein n=1 Tax=Neobacillus niacini TaxID=86668 RepID=UPI0007ABFF5D|nr:hypothetical protein [Neobacillus niacini]MEC1524473.1 hypothetical protein [Neobacillus niacini]